MSRVIHIVGALQMPQIEESRSSRSCFSSTIDVAQRIDDGGFRVEAGLAQVLGDGVRRIDRFQIGFQIARFAAIEFFHGAVAHQHFSGPPQRGSPHAAASAWLGNA
jgi:hypothetical protein